MARARSRSKIKVLIADGHAIFRNAIYKLLDSDDEITIVGEARNRAECIIKLGALKPDILVIDLRMPNKNALAVLDDVNFNTISTRVIVLTAAENKRNLIRAMRLGARGVVPKGSAIDLLVKCIHRVHAGELWLDSRMTAEVANALCASSKSDARSKKVLLSDREKKVVQLVAQGFQNREIGKKLFISDQTVKAHLNNIFDKLGVSDRVELMLYAIHHRLIDKPDATLAGTPLTPRTLN